MRIDLVQPTQYDIQPNRVAKSPPPELWPLPDFTPNLPPNLDRQYLAVVYAIYCSAERTLVGYLILSDPTLRNKLYRLFYMIFSGSPVPYS